MNAPTVRWSRWLYHAVWQDDPAWIAVDPSGAHPIAEYSPASLAAVGFAHTSYAPLIQESVALYMGPSTQDRDVMVLKIDPRLVPVRIELAKTPRGEMPHIYGPIPAVAIRKTCLRRNLNSEFLEDGLS
jgi:uncharacterized protein (DUF952 family)